VKRGITTRAKKKNKCEEGNNNKHEKKQHKLQRGAKI
jgi:hypothetical protein